MLADDSVLPLFSGYIQESDFENPFTRTLWSVCLELYQQDLAIDLATISARYSSKIAPYGGFDALLKVHNSYFRSSNVERYVDEIKEQSAKRKLRVILAGAQTQIELDTQPFGETLAEIERGILTVRPDKRRGGLRNDLDRIKLWWAAVEKRNVEQDIPSGIMTGWASVDGITQGFARGDVVVVAGRTSMGKSAFAIECFIRAGKAHKAGYISLEMSDDQILSRMASVMSGVPLWRIRTGKLRDNDWLPLTNAASNMQGHFICDERGLSADEIVTEIRRMKHRHGVDFVVVDYVQEVEESEQRGDNQGSKITRVMRKLRKVAQECDCAIMAVSQIGRESEKRSSTKEPGLGDLAGSAGIENVADMVILLYRDDYYNPESQKPGALQVNIAKHRNGPVGKVELLFLKDSQRIHDPKR